MILCFQTFLQHVLDAYFGYYLHALDMCHTRLMLGQLWNNLAGDPKHIYSRTPHNAYPLVDSPGYAL